MATSEQDFKTALSSVLSNGSNWNKKGSSSSANVKPTKRSNSNDLQLIGDYIVIQSGEPPEKVLKTTESASNKSTDNSFTNESGNFGNDEGEKDDQFDDLYLDKFIFDIQ